MQDLILKYYPEPSLYTYIYLRTLCEKNSSDFVKDSEEINESHLKALEISGLVDIIEDHIFLRKDGKWLCDPPEVKAKPKKEPYTDFRLDELASIVGYPHDWHKRGKYEVLFSKLKTKFTWETIKSVAKYFAENKPDPELSLNYFLTKNAFNGIKYNKENPKKKKEPEILSRFDIADDLGEESLW